MKMLEDRASARPRTLSEDIAIREAEAPQIKGTNQRGSSFLIRFSPQQKRKKKELYFAPDEWEKNIKRQITGCTIAAPSLFPQTPRAGMSAREVSSSRDF